MLYEVITQECQKYKLDGLFIVPCSRSNEHLEALNHVPFPVVVLTQLLSGFNCVAVDHTEGGGQVAEHLISMGP